MIENRSLSFFLLLMMEITVGCSLLRSSPFEETLKAQITSEVLFAQMAQEPSGHVGQIVKVGEGGALGKASCGPDGSDGPSDTIR
jgi:hypothetical protein